MALQILEQNGTFYLKGKLNTSTSKVFIEHLKHSIKKIKKVIINIENLKEIDVDGLKALNFLMNTSIVKKKIFSIRGYGCKEIYDHFNSSQIA